MSFLSSMVLLFSSMVSLFNSMVSLFNSIVVLLLADVDLASLTSSQGFQITGAAYSDHAGQSVTAGDVDGDGLAEIVLGACETNPLNRVDAGTVYVIWGNNTEGNSWERTELLSQEYNVFVIGQWCFPEHVCSFLSFFRW